MPLSDHGYLYAKRRLYFKWKGNQLTQINMDFQTSVTPKQEKWRDIQSDLVKHLTLFILSLKVVSQSKLPFRNDENNSIVKESENHRVVLIGKP